MRLDQSDGKLPVLARRDEGGQSAFKLLRLVISERPNLGTRETQNIAKAIPDARLMIAWTLAKLFEQRPQGV